MLARLQRFRFDWKLTLLTALLFPVLTSLGFWQLRREEEKLQLQSLYESRQAESAVELALLDPDEDLQYRQVRVSGTWVDAHVFLLDNRIYQGQPGYEVLMPLLSDSGTVVLVNRGWTAQGPYREELPAIEPLRGNANVEGSIYVPVGEQLLLGDARATEGWPKVVQTLDVVAMAAMAGFHDEEKVFPYSVRMSETTAGVLTRYWPVISITPEKHRAYAVQWFMMAIVLLGLYLHYSTKPLPAADGEDR